MFDPAKPDGADGANVPAPATGVPIDDVKDLVSAFKDTIAKLSAPVAAAPVATVPVEDPVHKREVALAAYNKAREEVNEQAIGGDPAGAMEKMWQAFSQLQAGTAGKPEDAPSTKALISSAKRASRTDNKELFDKYGAEIDATMAARSVEDRISPDAWDTAAKDVRAMHFDEILEAERAAIKAEFEANSGGVTPVANPNGRSRKQSGEPAASALSEDQALFAQSMGWDPAKYAKNVASYRKALVRPGSVRLMDEDDRNGMTIAPGRF